MVWSTIAQVFSFGSQWESNTIRLVQGNDASAMLKKVEGILEDSMRLLASHERILAQGEFNSFSVKHRNLLLKVIEIKQDLRDDRARGLLSANTTGHRPFRVDQQLSLLYKQAQIYQRDVITASRRAQAMEESAIGEVDSSGQLGSSETSEGPGQLGTQWSSHPQDRQKVHASVSLPSTTLTHSIFYVGPPDSLTSSTTGSETSTLVDLQPYLAIAHVRPSQSDPSGSTKPADDDSYREIILLESEEKTIIMINPNRRHLSKELDPSDETSLLEMSRAGEALLRTTDPHKLQGYEVIGAQQETSWVDSFVNTLSRLGVGIGADMM
ncbi:hypothetical protein RhiXN_03601 [Rhizoctonia solani]|uniref:Uncharacterized protein n=1 Tax=Rhizoctonia solani TaxID=456999 RepID=A0A8H7LFP8_9AGAM|nr:uncharacterized protein RhiXN_03601 [Rhizoctonia solani]KAF8668013.1 hypothetical protein RHS04_09199 [Rhizoctonia solani]QRW15600.1 hypothetical protein RhiXN_03601 [Rhizoctonia solani]